MSIKENEWDILKIYLARTQQGTISNLRAAYNYYKSKDRREIFFKLLQYVEMMDESEFSILAEQIFAP